MSVETAVCRHLLIREFLVVVKEVVVDKVGGGKTGGSDGDLLQWWCWWRHWYCSEYKNTWRAQKASHTA